MMSFLASSYKLVICVGSVIYAVSLVLLLLSKSEAEAHGVLSAIDPSLTSPVPVVDLATGCGLSNLKVALFDVHVITHFFGWFVTTLAFRDVVFSWVCGLVWEIIEGSLEHNIPELRECWWDKAFMDLFGCNNLGIFFAWLVMRYFKIEEFNWAKILTPDGSALHKLGFLYFVPGRDTLQQNYYGILKSGRTCMAFLYANLVILLYQLNLFFLKTALWLPTLHWIVSCRCLLIACLLLSAIPAAYKRYEVTGFPLLLNIVLALEGLLVVRFGASLLFIGKGNALMSVILMILSVFVFVVLSFVGIVQTCKSHINTAFGSCKLQKVS